MQYVECSKCQCWHGPSREEFEEKREELEYWWLGECRRHPEVVDKLGNRGGCWEGVPREE